MPAHTYRNYLIRYGIEKNELDNLPEVSGKELEAVKIDVIKEAKALSTVSKPNLPDGHTYPDRPEVFITLIIVMLLLYGISSMLYNIIKDHKE